MGKTYNSKYDYLKNYNKEDDYKDPSKIYTSGDIHAHIKTSRHPNKKKKAGSLRREFHIVGLNNIAYWRFRFGEADYKSNRMHLSKREQKCKRRNRLKHESEEEIERSLND